MITIDSNAENIINTIEAKLSDLQISEMTRLQAATLMAEMRQRIHVRGEATNGSPIGSYTTAYMRTRKKHGRTEPQNKVVLSLTRSMEQGMVLIPIENGTGIGYTTQENLQKARWQEKREKFNRPIFSPSQRELDLIHKVAQDYVTKHIQQ